MIETTSGLRENAATVPGLRRSGLISIVSFGLAGFVAVAWIGGDSLPEAVAFLLVVLAAALAALPVILQARNGKFDLFHPMVYASFTAILPMVVLKGAWVLLSGTFSGGLSLTPDPLHFLILGLGYSVVGYAFLMAGFYGPMGNRLGKLLPMLKGFGWGPRQLPVLGFTAFLVGVAITFWLASLGAFSYGLFSGDITYLHILQRLSDLRIMGLFILMFAWANAKLRPPYATMLLGAAVITEFSVDLAAGGRSRLMASVLLLVAAYQYARFARLRMRTVVVAVSATLIALVVGIILGTLFREERLAAAPFSSPTSVADVPAFVSSSVGAAKSLSASEAAAFVGDVAFYRLESLDNLSLVLAYSSSLKAAERQAGIEQNIVKDIVFSFIPRFIWRDKPAVSNFGLVFYRLYYRSDLFSWRGPTAVGDLFRNFGPVGVAAGMFLLGLLLRAIYSWLIEHETPGAAQALLFVLLTTRIGYEGTYSAFFTNAVYSLVIFAAFLAVVRFVRIPMPSSRLART